MSGKSKESKTDSGKGLTEFFRAVVQTADDHAIAFELRRGAEVVLQSVYDQDAMARILHSVFRARFLRERQVWKEKLQAIRQREADGQTPVPEPAGALVEDYLEYAAKKTAGKLCVHFRDHLPQMIEDALNFELTVVASTAFDAWLTGEQKKPHPLAADFADKWKEKVWPRLRARAELLSRGERAKPTFERKLLRPHYEKILSEWKQCGKLFMEGKNISELKKEFSDLPSDLMDQITVYPPTGSDTRKKDNHRDLALRHAGRLSGDVDDDLAPSTLRTYLQPGRAKKGRK